MNKYVDKQWRQRYNQSIIENPIAKKTIQDDYLMRETKTIQEYMRIRNKSLLFPVNK